MIHHHFEQIDSTQKFLLENLTNLLDKDDQILISCQEQTNGIGRNQNSWQDSLGSIAMSFSFPAQSKLTLIPLWIAVSMNQFLKEKYQIDLQIKWPNDLYFQSKKCGGIICQKNHNDYVVIGLGLNLFKNPILNDGLNNPTHLNLRLDAKFKSTFPEEFYLFLLKQNFNEIKLNNIFLNHALYINEKIEISEPNTPVKIGFFKGIGEYGEALIQTNSGIEKILNGTMRPFQD